MKALVLTGPRQFTYTDVPVAQPGEDEMLMQMEACAICGSDCTNGRCLSTSLAERKDF